VGRKNNMQHKISRALISVSDKTGIQDFARELTACGVELLSTGGTYKALREADIAVREVSEYTGFPEIMDGRVKTLHPKVHGGILAVRDNSAHEAAMGEHGIAAIDLVVINLYPFEATVAKDGVERDEAVEQIDIGGPSMVRSAAKNHRHVGVVTDPGDYAAVALEMKSQDGGLGEDLRRRLAAKAFALTARYDTAISGWLLERDLEDGVSDDPFPDHSSLAGSRVMTLRYGENPHQTAAFYRLPLSREPSLATAEVLNGKALSYNNLVDADAALAIAKEFDEPFVAVTKHNNPCGAAAAPDVGTALEKAWAGDPISAFGSVLAFTRAVDMASAEFLVSGNRFVEVIVAPSFDQDAFDLLTQKPKWGKSVRLLACGPFGPASRHAGELELKKLVGGFLLQGRDLKTETPGDAKVVTKERPTEAQLASLLFANVVAKHVKSNAIVLATNTEILGVGAGQMSRVDAVRLSVHKAGDRVSGSVLASDAFFPFPDGVEAAIDSGVSAILQPGGSVRDDQVIAACDARGVPMVFTGSRHFRH
jgi:phosphoribosylaminoimidazolecarboxamide formyltransferase/IMP cyclohydrolase